MDTSNAHKLTKSFLFQFCVWLIRNSCQYQRAGSSRRIKIIFIFLCCRALVQTRTLSVVQCVFLCSCGWQFSFICVSMWVASIYAILDLCLYTSVYMCQQLDQYTLFPSGGVYTFVQLHKSYSLCVFISVHTRIYVCFDFTYWCEHLCT